MRSRRFYIPVMIVLCILLVVSNLYQWNRQNKVKENIEEMMNRRFSLFYDAVAVTWELTPDTDVSNTPDLTHELEIVNYLAVIYSQFSGNSEREKDIQLGLDKLTYMLGDYLTLFNNINAGMPYDQSKEFLDCMNAHLALVADIPDITQHDLDERLLAFLEAESDKEMREKYGSLPEISSIINRLPYAKNEST